MEQEYREKETRKFISSPGFSFWDFQEETEPIWAASSQDYDKFSHPSFFFSKAVETSSLALWHTLSDF